MKIFSYIRKGLPIQYNNFIAVTPVPGLKFTNWYGKNINFFFWHVVLGFGFLVALAVNLKFWYKYQFSGFLLVYAELEQGVKLAFPAIYLCSRHSLNPKKLAKYRKNFLLPNSTMSVETIDSELQHLFRAHRAALNPSHKHPDALKNNIDMVWLEKNIDKLFFNVDDQLKDCSFQGLHRDCKEIFKSVDMAFGQCFVFNSIFTAKNLHEDPYRVWYVNTSESDDDWSLRFKILSSADNFAMLYFKHPQNLLSLRDFPRHIWYPIKQVTDYEFSISRYICEDTLRSVSLETRFCHFSDETFSEPNLKAEFNAIFYDVGVCLNYCHARMFQKLCRCWPNFAKVIFPKTANKSRICSIKDMECYENNYLAVRQMQCSECLLNCNGALYDFDLNEPDLKETEINRLSFNSSSEIDYFELNIQLIYWPLIYLRYMNVYSRTEFILTAASTACLFLGISILTFMEIFYNLFIRFPLFYFINWEYFVRTAQKQEDLERTKAIPCINMRLWPGLRKN